MVQKFNNNVAANDIKGYTIDISERNEMIYIAGLKKISLFIEGLVYPDKGFVLCVDLTDLPKQGYSPSEIETIKSNIAEGLECLNVKYEFDEGDSDE